MANVYGKIWRTVVFSGAMLGAPGVALADAPAKKGPAETKPAPPPPPKANLDQLQKDMVELDKKIAAAIDAVAAAQTDKDRTAAVAKLAALRKEKAALQDKIAAAKGGDAKPKVEPSLDKLQREMDELNAKIDKAVDAVMAAQSDADRSAANAKLKALRKDKEALEAKITAEKARLAKRPRAKDEDRPIGRGFILA
jgi:peptidoglycan hydrolase CwlO-like protein